MIMKPMFGECRAPRFWWNKAQKTLGEVHLVQRRLDKCLWMSYRKEDRKLVLDRILGVHVNDLLGGGSTGGGADGARGGLAS